MRKDRKFSDEEEFNEYLKLGAYLKILCKISVITSVEIAGDFGKTHNFHKRIYKISHELEKLRSDLEDSMPYNETTELCKKYNMDPLDIFYSYEHRNKTNDSQMKIIYDKFLKKFIESEN